MSSFVIGRLLRLSSYRTGWLAGLINASRIAVAGHSDGGDTMAALAAARCCDDRAIRAAFILSGAEWPSFNGWFTRRTPPMMFVQGTDDAWNAARYSMQLYEADTTGPRYYLDLPGADHFSPYEGRSAPEPLVARVTLDFLNAYLAGQTSSLIAMRRAARVRGVAELVSDGRLP